MKTSFLTFFALLTITSLASAQSLTRMIDGGTPRCVDADDVKYNAAKKTTTLEITAYSVKDNIVTVDLEAKIVKCKATGWQQDPNPGSETYETLNSDGTLNQITQTFEAHGVAVTDRNYKLLQNLDLNDLKSDGIQEFRLTLDISTLKEKGLLLLVQATRKMEMSNGYKDSQRTSIGSYFLKLKE